MTYDIYVCQMFMRKWVFKMAAENIVERIQDSFLSCSICFQPYNRPKALPCLHTFCEGCLRDYITSRFEDTGQFPCPLCRQVCWIFSWIVSKVDCIDNRKWYNYQVINTRRRVQSWTQVLVTSQYTCIIYRLFRENICIDFVNSGKESSLLCIIMAIMLLYCDKISYINLINPWR